MNRSASLRDQLTAGIVAGLIGGVLFQAVFSVASGFRATPSTLIAPDGTLLYGGVGVTVSLHYLAAIGWAFGYIYAVRSQPQLAQRALVAGLSYGIVVYVFMQIVLLTSGLYHRPSSPALLWTELFAYALYGIVVAQIISRGARSDQR